MDLKTMLDQLDELSKVLDGKSNDLSALARQIGQHVDALNALDGGTGNTHVRRALETLRNAAGTCRNATVPITQAKVASRTYINSVRR